MSQLEQIATSIATRFDVTVHQLRYGNVRACVDARHAVYWVAAQRGMSANEVAAWFGMDHTTVDRGLRRMEQLLGALVAEE